ncbi:hypothetical protein LTR97_005701 [Elasticomyces elasticus]|uniref:Protein kinase domain-containing protein n=1 Tax=Elasticomyces elasticus TaxID=574655 RepID=A0AAN8A145_9PEZI|nr:hypothetical protein LTR97_005701 [Elasticomyces elasticus]
MANPRFPSSEHGPYQCLRSSLTVAEVQDIETGHILCVTCSGIDSYGAAWFGQISGVRKYDLSDEDLWGLLKPLPDEHVYPLMPPGLDIHDHNGTDCRYIKRANLVGSEDAQVAKILPMIVLEEAKVLQSLKQLPHPNLIRFYGCILKDNRIAGLVLEKYPRTLQQYFDQGQNYDFGDFKAKAWMHGLQAGIQHLHSLGLAHNDLNPMNVALDQHDNVVIIDLGSCRRVGENLNSAGTPGWFDEDDSDWAVSAKAHDEFALQKIESWLDGKSFQVRRDDT